MEKYVYKPTRFMLPTSHYDKEKADRAVKFIEMLCHTKGEFSGKPFWLLPWQEQLVRDIYGVIKEDGTRQFKTAFVEIPKKNCIAVLVHRNVFVKILIELRENRKAGRATA